MAIWAIGDVQGCYYTLQKLLGAIGWGQEDRLIFLGDVVNRGLHSLPVLQFLSDNRHRLEVVLGNHDLHLLALAEGLRPASRGDTLEALLAAPEAVELLAWLRTRPLALRHRVDADLSYLCVHAGVLPQWSSEQALGLAGEVSTALQSADWRRCLQDMFGNSTTAWHDEVNGVDRLRLIVNGLTRLRLLRPDGTLEFNIKEREAGAGLTPWFQVPALARKDVLLFGHWASLGLYFYPNQEQPRMICLDSGCVWRGYLSAMRLEDGKLVQVTVEARDLP